MSGDLLDGEVFPAEPSCAQDYSSRCSPFLILGGWYCVRCGEVPRVEVPMRKAGAR